MNQPTAIKAEQSILGCLLMPHISGKVLSSCISSDLKKDDFSNPLHQNIYLSICEMAEEGIGVDVISVRNRLKNKELLNDQKIKEQSLYIYELPDRIATASNYPTHISMIRTASIARRTQKTFVEASEKVSDQWSIEEVIEQTEEAIFSYRAELEKEKKERSVKELAKTWAKDFEMIFKGEKENTLGDPSPWETMTDNFVSWNGGSLVILGGRPSMGKTALALDIASFFAIDLKKPVPIFSLEMPAQQLMTRLISARSGIPSLTLRDPKKLNPKHLHKVMGAVGDISKSKIRIYDDATMTPLQVRAECQRMQSEHGDLGLIVIDYLQLMESGKEISDRRLEIESISNALRIIAKDLNTPILLLSQLSRALEKRPDKRPIMSDLRDTGKIEQDAEAVLFVYRDEVYNSDTDDKGIAEIIIGKQRGGKLGTFRLKWNPETTSFEEQSQ